VKAVCHHSFAANRIALRARTLIARRSQILFNFSAVRPIKDLVANDDTPPLVMRKPNYAVVNVVYYCSCCLNRDADVLWNGRGRRPQRGRGPRLALTPRRTGRRSVWRGEDEAPPSRASKRANKDSRGWPSTRPFFCWSQTPQATRVFDPRAVGLPQVKAAGLVQTYGLQLPKKDMATPREAYRGCVSQIV
jgi:hypothetical protein